jgi:hypothetical protein
MMNVPVLPVLPEGVYGAGDAQLSSRVASAFVGENDPVVLRRKAYAHARAVLERLPEDVRIVDMGGELALFENLDWIVAMLGGMFSPKRLLSMSAAEMEALVRGLLTAKDLESFSHIVSKGPGLASLASLVGRMGSMGSSGASMVLNPLERVSLRWLSVLASMVPVVTKASSMDSQYGSGSIPYSVQLLLSQGLQRPKIIGKGGTREV